MIKFFRKIRQQLLSENKFSKYLIYALGEIVLVVIGILIALGLNDYNAKVKSQDRLTGLLKEVRTELAVNINRSTPLLQWYSERDSLISMIMSDTLAKEVYATDMNIRKVIEYYDTYEVKSNAFDRLMANNSSMPAQYDTLIDDLKTIYVSEWEIVKSLNKSVEAVVLENNDRIKKTKSWYSDWVYSSGITEEATEMMFSDSIYRNYVAEYWLIGVSNHAGFIQLLRSDAYIVYLELSNELGLPDKVGPALMKIFNTSNCPGKYVFENDTISISEKDGRLLFQFPNRDVEELLPFDESQFIPSKTFAFCRLTKDENGQVNGLTFRTGSYNKTFQKQNYSRKQ
ncbi:MAG: hypothetical protein ACPGU4_03185 [Flavobacteriales bacterium]